MELGGGEGVHVGESSPSVFLFLPTGILQRLGTDVHSAVTAKMSIALWQRKRARRCDSDGVDSNVTVLTVTALGHQWLWHWCDSDVYISVTAMATDTAVTAVTTDSAVPVVLSDSWQCCDVGGSWQRCDSDVYISVTALSVATTFTVMCTSLSH